MCSLAVVRFWVVCWSLSQSKLKIHSLNGITLWSVELGVVLVLSLNLEGHFKSRLKGVCLEMCSGQHFYV